MFLVSTLLLLNNALSTYDNYKTSVAVDVKFDRMFVATTSKLHVPGETHLTPPHATYEPPDISIR